MNFAKLTPYVHLIREKFEEKKDKPFFKGGLGSLIIKFGNTFLQFGVGVVLARTLGVEAFGVYTFIYAIIKIIAIPTELGLPNLLIRFIPQYHVNEKWGRIKGLLTFTNGAVLTISILVISVSLTLLYSGIIDFNAVKSQTFLWGLALLPILALGNIRGASLRGFRYFLLGLIPESLLRHTFFIGLLLIFFYINGGKITAPEGMMYQAIAALGGYIIGAYWLLKYIPPEVKKAQPKYEYRHWTKVALPFLLIGGVQIIMGKIDIVLLGILRTSAEVGIYEVAYKAAALVAFSLGAFNFILGPYFSRYYNNNQMKDLQKIATFSVVLNGTIALGVAAFFMVFGEFVLEFVFGHKYSKGYYVLLILTAAQLSSVLSGSVGLLLNMTGKESKVLTITIVTAILNIVLNLLLIPNYGIEGAAIASFITILLWNTILGIMSIKYLDINPSIGSVIKYIKR